MMDISALCIIPPLASIRDGGRLVRLAMLEVSGRLAGRYINTSLSSRQTEIWIYISHITGRSYPLIASLITERWLEISRGANLNI